MTIPTPDGKIIWFNLRQEPLVPMEHPLCARPSTKWGVRRARQCHQDSVKEQEVDFLKTCKARAEENGGKLKYVDINKNAKGDRGQGHQDLSAHVEKLKEKFPGLALRGSRLQLRRPLETDYDIIVSTPWWVAASTPRHCQ